MTYYLKKNLNLYKPQKVGPLYGKNDNPKEKTNSSGSRILNIILDLLIIIVLIFGRHSIEGQSMYPTYHDGDTAYTMRLFTPIKSGDVVVAKSPTGPELFIKRIAGCPGDTVEIHPDGTIWVNGKHFEYGEGNALTPQAFSYGHGYMDDTEDGGKRVTLGEREYFLIGDNHEHSSDSRFYGAFPRTSIWEKVISPGHKN